MAETLTEWADELRENGQKALQDAKAVVKRGAQNIKTDWRADAARQTPKGFAKLYPSSITYDELSDAGSPSVEIGPDKALPQGALGNLMEYGSVNNAPQGSGGNALQHEEPKFIEQMSKLGGFK